MTFYGRGVDAVDPRLRSALARQFAARLELLQGGARRIGWKLGMGEAERIGREVALGYLTSASVVSARSTWMAGRDAALHADAELALEMAQHVTSDADDAALRDAVGGYGTALEIVDLGDAPKGPEAVVADNVFHRAVAFGRFHREMPAGSTNGRLVVNGEVRATAPVDVDVAARVRAVARLLEAMGEQLRRGDRLITGSVVQVAIRPGDKVVADLGHLGDVAVSIAPE
jgi:2-keto-4-pentenoate hydratase